MTITRVKTLITPPGLLLGADHGNTSFGSCIAIDETNDNVIVSDTTKSHDFGAGAKECGSVTVLDWSTGVLVQEISPENAIDQEDGAIFGKCIAQDGDWLVIGCGQTDAVLGTVYFYEWTGASFTYRQRLTGVGPPDVNGRFGYALDVSGSLCVVGDYRADNNGSNSGTVHIFRLSAGTWSEDTSALQHSVTVQSNQYFGWAISVDGNYILVSASYFFGDHNDQGRAYVFEDGGLGNFLTLRATLTPSEINVSYTYFADSVSISGDFCAIGWPRYELAGGKINSGRIEIFKRDGVSWTYHQSLDAPLESKDINAELGWGLDVLPSVNLNGTFLVGGAHAWAGAVDPGGNPGAAFLWRYISSTDLFESIPVDGSGNYPIYPEADAEFGSSLAVTSAGNMAIGGFAESANPPEGDPASTSGGTVRLYEVTSTAPVTSPTPGDGAVEIPANLSLVLIVTDVDNDLDDNTVTITVDGDIVWTSDAASSGWSGTKSAISNGNSYVLTSPVDLTKGKVIAWSVVAEDDFGNTIADSWSFQVETDPFVRHQFNIPHIQTIGALTPVSEWNQFDEHGNMVSLPRLKEEKNWEYKRRIQDVFVNRANSSYVGLVNGITRELGLSLFEGIQIDPKRSLVTEAFFAPDPYIKFDQIYLYLYSDYQNNVLDYQIDRYIAGGNYEQLGTLVDFINNTTYFEASLVSTDYNNTRSMAILNQSNRGKVRFERIPISTKFRLKNPYVVSGTVYFGNRDVFRTEVSSELAVIARGDYYINHPKGIVTVYSMPTSGDVVRYEYTMYPFKAWTSPVILHDINNENFKAKMFEQVLQGDGTYAHGITTELGLDIINELLSVVPMYWGI